MAMTSDELNFLVYRYLQESGFMHAAFTFAYESQLAKSNVISSELPPGALISFVQKGLQYVGIEAHINEDGSERECSGELSLLNPHICRIAQSGNTNSSAGRSLVGTTAMSSVGGTGGKSSNKRKRKSGDHSIFSETTRGGGTDTNHHHHHQTTAGKTKNETSTSNTINGSSATIGENDNTNNNNNKKQQQQQIDTMDSSTMVLLTGHEKEVFRCVWNPTKNVVATGSSDATARIWEIPTDFFTYSTTHEKPTTLIIPKVLVHGIGEDRDVTTIDWNHDGTLLATGAHNGKTRIWSSDGEIKHTFQYHKGPVFSVCWNPTSQFLLSAGIDKTVAIWDVQNEQKKQQIRLHDDAILDACWKDETMFATCSADLKICLTRVGENHSFVTFKGHTSAVNSIKWDPSRKLLASCSDDHTIRIWDTTKALEEVSSTTTTENTSSTSPPITTTVAAAAAGTTTTENKNSITESSSSSSSPNSKMSSKNFLVHTLAEHEKEVYTIRWSPPNAETLSLASASFDHTVKIWDISTGTCTRTFEHQDAVHGVEYSPNGTFLASGTVNGRVYVWSLKDGQLIKSYQIKNGDVYELSWNKQGNLLAACLSSGDVAIMNFRM